MSDNLGNRLERVQKGKSQSDAVTMQQFIDHVQNIHNPHKVKQDQIGLNIPDIDYDLLSEFETLKLNLMGIEWAQFAFYDTFIDESLRETPDPSSYRALVENGKLKTRDITPSKVFVFLSKTYTEVNVLDSGISTNVISNTLTDSSKTWWINQFKNLVLEDSGLVTYNILSNTSNVLTLNGSPSFGAYKIKADYPQRMVGFANYIDSTNDEDGKGYCKLEITFNNGSTWFTLLDTQSAVNNLNKVIDISAYSTGTVKVRITVSNDVNGFGPQFSNFLIAADPTIWKF
ncbi:MAG TPA: hypothetical protein VI815_03040 [Candidatus Nanoarchaeia archaeon]|nr:hypothetical protein [Candidatus Nanoarchaeia archaeon]